MPIDPNIAMSVRPVELPDPVEQYAKMQQIQSMKNANRLADLTFQEKQEATQRTKGLREMMSGFTPDMKAEDQVGALTRGGYLEEARKLAESNSKVSKDKRDAEKAQLEVTHKKIEMAAQVSGVVRDNPTPENAHRALDFLGQNGIYTPEQVAQGKAWIEANPDPAGIKAMADQTYAAAMSVKDQIPKIETRNLGSTTETFSVSPLSGKVTTLSERGNTQSPDSKASERTANARLTFDKEKDVESKGKGQIVTTADGGIVLVDQRGGTAKPVTDADGKQIIGKMPGQLTPKQIADAKGKLQSIKVMRMQLDNLKTARANLGGLSQGIVAGRNPLSEAGSNYDKALAALQTTIRQLTRTPGEGAMSDYESRMAQAQLPMRADFPSSIDQGISQLEDLANVVETGYTNMLGSVPHKPDAAPPGGKPGAKPSLDEIFK